MRCWLSIIVVFAALLWAAPASSQSADALNQEALEAFSAGEYETAAEKFAEAYSEEPDPIFRKSEAVAWFKAERCEPAIKAANAFLLEWREAGEEATQAESVIANCKIELAEDAMTANSFELAERLLFEAEDHAQDRYTRDRISTTRVELARMRKAAATDEGESPVSDTEDASDTEVASSGEGDDAPAAGDPADPSRSSPAGPIGVVAGGAMIVGAVVWHTVTLLSTVPRLEAASQGGPLEDYQRLAGAVDTARWAVPALYAAGATTLGVGVWFWFKKGSNERPTGGSEAGVSVLLRF